MFSQAIEDVCSPTTLRAAWEHVHEADSADGFTAPSIQRFAQDVDANIRTLAEELASSGYRPRPLTPVSIPKADGTRELHVPSARDRVVERALLGELGPFLDRRLSMSSFAYRPGTGVVDAIRRVAELRDAGWTWVVRTDIDDCFPSVDRNRLLLRLEQLVAEPMLDLITSLVQRPIRYGHRLVDRQRGIPQGGALSPVLANLILDRLDRDLLGQGHQLVRYADDLAILARSRKEANDALAAARIAAERLGFSLGEDKTMIVSFEGGFYFLGEEVGPKYPPASPTARRTEPTRKTLYVGAQGARVRMERGRVVVATKNNKEALSVPSGHVARIVLAGSVGFSAGTRSWALANGISVTLLSRRGSYLGALVSGATDARLLRAQLAASTPGSELSLSVARQIIDGKLQNQHTLLSRFVDPDSATVVSESQAQMKQLLVHIDSCSTPSELLGTEGMAARFYWEAVGALVPSGIFEGRASRPPPDVVNAALGYGYAILAGECTTACRIAGLDPSFGLLHAESGRRPSLALDLMEEFRPLVVDQVVVELCRRDTLSPDQVRADTARGGVLLTEKGRRALVAGIEDRLLTVSHHVATRTKLTYRRQIQVQARSLVRAILNGEPYQAVLWR